MPIRLLNVTTNTNATSPYLLQGLQIPTSIYQAFISVARNASGDTQLDANQRYWLRNGNGQLEPIRLDFQEIKTAPSLHDQIAISLDTLDSPDNPLRLYVGDDVGSAVELDHATGASVRIRCIFSRG